MFPQFSPSTCLGERTFENERHRFLWAAPFVTQLTVFKNPRECTAEKKRPLVFSFLHPSPDSRCSLLLLFHARTAEACTCSEYSFTDHYLLDIKKLVYCIQCEKCFLKKRVPSLLQSISVQLELFFYHLPLTPLLFVRNYDTEWHSNTGMLILEKANWLYIHLNLQHTNYKKLYILQCCVLYYFYLYYLF